MTLYEMTAAQKELYELMTSGEIAEKIEGYCVVENELAGAHLQTNQSITIK